MATPHRTLYLFLLRRSSPGARRQAAEWLREQGATVTVQHGEAAIEALVTPEQAQAADDSGVFAAQLKGPMSKEHIERLGPEQADVVRAWNASHTARYRKIADDRTHEGRSWSDPEFDEPAPYSPIEAEDLLALLEDYAKRTGQDVPGPGRATAKSRKPRTGEEFVAFERELADRYGDVTFAYHLARAGYRLGREYDEVLLNLPQELVEELRRRWPFPVEEACWRMTGEMSVGIVFVEGAKSGQPKFTATERTTLENRIKDGHTWLTTQHPTGNLSWVYDVQHIQIDVANGTGDPKEGYWRDPAMGALTYHGQTFAAAWSSVAEYREAMRVRNRSAHALVIFVTPYATDWYAYAGSGRVTLDNRGNWGGWGINAIDMITAHETSHLYGSADEYGGSGTPCSSCATLHGCDQIPNGNCASCSSPHQDCVMDAFSYRLCGYTRGHIGWGHLFVETTTGDVQWAGTDDDVWVDIGSDEFVLDTPDFDDRERGAREGYAIWAPWLERDDIERILIRKSPDGWAGGWRLGHARVWFGGALICDRTVNKWLEDDHRFWLGCTWERRRPVVNTLQLKVRTADVQWAGTDDDVTLRLAGRDWNVDNEGHDDFERGNTDTFNLDPGTALHVDDITSIRISKSSDGVAGGWKLAGLQLIVNGTTIYNNQAINQWLEDDTRVFTDGV